MAVETASLSRCPDDFAPGVLNRDELWTDTDNLHAYIEAQRCAHAQALSAQAAEVAELRSIADAAWAGRFQDAAAYKVQLLKRAHSYALTRLRCAWGAEGTQPTTADETPECSIHALDAELLELVVARVPGTPDEDWAPDQCTFTSRRRDKDMPWLRRRELSQVCRLFEALAYATVADTFHGLGSRATPLPQLAPIGVVERDLERIALSTSLTRLQLFLPGGDADASEGGVALRQTTPAAVALSLCLSLKALELYCGGGNGAATLLVPFIDALPAGECLTRLLLGACDTDIMNWPVLDSCCVDLLAASLARMHRLVELNLTSLDLQGLCGPLVDALQLCTALRDLTLRDLTPEIGWTQIFAVQQLSRRVLNFKGSNEWKSSWPEPGHALCTSVRTLCLRKLYMDAECHVGFAEWLPSLTELTELDLNVVPETIQAFGGIVAAFCVLPRLERLALGCSHGLQDTTVGTTLFLVLQSCACLKSLTLYDDAPATDHWFGQLAAALPKWHIEELVLDGVRGMPNLRGLELLELAPLFAALPACTTLRKLSVLDAAVTLEDASNLCAILNQALALQLVQFTDERLGSIARSLLVGVTALLPRLELELV